MRSRLEIEVLTPLFIGNGDKYAPFEYVYECGCFTPVNMDKLIEINYKEGNTRLLEDLQKGGSDLYTLCRNYSVDYRRFARYTLNSPRLSSRDEVLQYIKSGGRVFIPGSSLKGAIRSTLTRYEVNSAPGLELFTETITKAFEAMQDKNATRKYSAQRLDDETERKILGMTYDSPFRFVSISDSDLHEADVLEVSELKILNICNGRVKWFHGPGSNVDDPSIAKSLFVEGVKRNSSLTCVLTIEEPSSYIARESGTKNPEIVNDMVSKINEEIKKYIRKEYEFYKVYGSSAKPISDFYSNLLGMAESFDDNELLLQVGFGTGMLSKTIIEYFDEDLKSKVAKISKHKYYDGDIYPKTRKIVFEDGLPKYVPGWIKCRMLPDDDRL